MSNAIFFMSNRSTTHSHIAHDKIHAHSEYTEQDGGQKKIGGWNQAGIREFNRLFRAYVLAKHNVDADAMAQANQGNIRREWIAKEQAFLVKLQTHHNVQPNAAGGRRQGGDQVAAAEPVEEALGIDF